MIQGDTFLEGISLRDESYDGKGSKWDRRVDPLLQQSSLIDKDTHQQQQNQHPQDPTVKLFQEEEDVAEEAVEEENESFQLSQQSSGSSSSISSSPMENQTGLNINPLLTDGLGQLTDKIEGASSFTMDIGYGLGK